MTLIINETLSISAACGFADNDDDINTYIMTGGWYRTKVRKYSKSGWMEDLPDLNTGKDYVVGMRCLLGLMFENWILFDNLILFYLLSLFHSGYRLVMRGHC